LENKPVLVLNGVAEKMNSIKVEMRCLHMIAMINVALFVYRIKKRRRCGQTSPSI